MSRARSRPSKTTSTTSGARPRDISSAIMTLGSTARARAKASICCSPPDRLPARCVLRLPRTGKSSTARLMASSRSRAPAGCTHRHPQVVDHRETRENAPSFGDVREPRPVATVGRPPTDVVAAEPDPPTGQRHQPGQRSGQRALPGAVGSEERHDASGEEVDRHVGEGARARRNGRPGVRHGGRGRPARAHDAISTPGGPRSRPTPVPAAWVPETRRRVVTRAGWRPATGRRSTPPRWCRATARPARAARRGRW